MKLSPLDLRQRGFPLAIRGFDRAAVTSFLVQASDDFELALMEIERLRRDLASAEAQLTEHRERDTTLRNALLTAQKVSDEIKLSAEQEARATVREAEGRAQLLLEKAQGRLEDVERDIDALKARRRELEASVEKSLAAVQTALEAVRAENRGDDKVLLHRRRLIDAATPSAEAPAEDEAAPDAQQA
jgi:cell division initiation protein